MIGKIIYPRIEMQKFAVVSLVSALATSVKIGQQLDWVDPSTLDLLTTSGVMTTGGAIMDPDMLK